MSYPLERLYEEVAHVARYLHWSRDQVLALEHRERQAWVKEVSRVNERLNEAAKAGR